ncbi:hypothetical protein [Pseudarthrobacter sp. NIBRBAC000502770]|uniref:hypothetical protein n=1 Tax=Pseudarthrobacter sp. NIBRBAC000502770 TaxID=2590785 RepID=UPI001AEFFC58|nr:hypothetical protein [Pseudarthrobacter sp. NIBRBAC000502770]
MAGDQGIVAQLERAARRHLVWAWLNVGIAVVGVVLSLSSYNTATPGSRYVVFGGAIGGGILFAIVNTVRYFRAMNLLIRIAEAAEGSQPPATASPAPQPAPSANHANGQKLQVFNPPPGWPKTPEGWRPGPGWEPDPSWPAPPAGWSFLVDPDLQMAPVDLSADLYLGAPAGVTKQRLDDISDRAADAIAWQVSTVAGERRENPLTTLATSPQHVGTAVVKAKERIFTRLLAEANSWTQESQGNIHQWEAALQHTRMIMERREAFEVRAHRRINAVLSAATAPPQQAPAAPPRTPGARPTPAYSPPPRKEGHAGLIALAAALVILIAGGLAVGISQTGTSSSRSDTSSAVNPSFNPAVVKALEGQGDWFQSGSFYVKWVPHEQYTCNPGVACTEILLETPLYSGCGSAEAMVDLLQNGKAIGTARGRANNMTTGVPQRVHIQAAPGLNPDKVQVNHVSCTG